MHIIKHFMTVSRHRHAVIRHCAKAGILYRGLLHDLSKYSPVEFINGAPKLKSGGKTKAAARTVSVLRERSISVPSAEPYREVPHLSRLWQD